MSPAPIRIETPQCEPGIGKVIGSPGAAGLIEGVQVAPCALWADDRGYFLEVARLGHGLPAGFPPDSTQISAALSYPGAIKAFHFHRHQTDFWTAVHGMLQVALVDLRPESPTFGRKNTLYIGALRNAERRRFFIVARIDLDVSLAVGRSAVGLGSRLGGTET